MSSTLTTSSQIYPLPSSLRGNSENLTILEILSQQKRFEVFVKLLQMTPLKETLSQQGTYTLLAPTNEAFEQLPKQVIMALFNTKNRVLRQSFLKTYLLEGEATIFQANFRAKNGIIYTVHQILMPDVET